MKVRLLSLISRILHSDTGFVLKLDSDNIIKKVFERIELNICIFIIFLNAKNMGS